GLANACSRDALIMFVSLLSYGRCASNVAAMFGYTSLRKYAAWTRSSTLCHFFSHLRCDIDFLLASVLYQRCV
ncbi:hypothetical protein F5887DRAFT_994804, partial [Amanita rubescens]